MTHHDNPWLPRRAPRGEASLDLFCFPHAGGATAAYHRWASEFPAALEVVPVLLPGRERRLAEPAFSDLAGLTAALTEGLAPRLHRPFALFGHSMGGLVAFEFARQLRRRGMPEPVHVFVAAYRAPHLAAGSSPMHQLDDADLIAAIQERFGGIPSQISGNPELLALFLPALRADITAVETYRYRPEPPLECPITALGGAEDRQVSAAELSAWRVHTAEDFVLKMLPGGHFFVSQHAAEVARLVRNRLQPCLA